MKHALKHILTISFIVTAGIILSAFYNDTVKRYSYKFPYKQAGLTPEQAAAHLLSRFSYGATPGQIEEVEKQGLENWFNRQLSADLPDDSLNKRLAAYDALKLSNTEAALKYPKPNLVLRMAIKDSVIHKDSVNSKGKVYRDQLQGYMQQKGLRPEAELFRQFINQKVLRAAYSNNQLQEVMTSFWFNHFNVSLTKNDCAQFIPAYERDVIRPNATGKFGDLLLATAQSPAMLYYLDNFNSSGAVAGNNNAQAAFKQRLIMNAQVMGGDTAKVRQAIKPAKPRNSQGLNENYAREVMELHTLGVDGGYTQQDVTNAAKVLTGWTIYPLGTYGLAIQNQLNKLTPQQLENRGFVHNGDFLFNPNRHDRTEKTVMGKTFANGGYQEGVDLLNMLAHKEATAKFITKKLAVRFVSDNPPKSLLDKMTKTFMQQDGSIKDVLITMVSSPEFWASTSVREKTRSPFELTIASVRALNADIQQPYALFNWINRMGEKMYYYIAPTGFPDRGQYWINTGALLNRMNFGLAVASGRIPGVKINLVALNNNHEPESAKAALNAYGKMLLPGRDLSATIKRLTPMLTDPALMQKVDNASNKVVANSDVNTAKAPKAMADSSKLALIKRQEMANNMPAKTAGGTNTMLAQVVGVIIGSPEYQRR